MNQDTALSFRASSYRSWKRALDLLVAGVLVIVCSPLMMLISVGIKLHSPGPILYRQKRVGKDGRTFDMLKFRSMREGSTEDAHKNHVQDLIKNNSHPADLGGESLKIKFDTRITGLGRLLRRLSLDELPQFFNVLRGEMSIVGPRPPLPYEYELYNEHHKHRLAVLPGITGLWQVEARNQVSFEEMVELDLRYIEEMNLWLDLKIMVRTPIEMIRGKGGG